MTSKFTEAEVVAAIDTVFKAGGTAEVLFDTRTVMFLSTKQPGKFSYDCRTWHSYDELEAQ